MDWSKIKLPEPKRNRPEVSRLAPYDFWRLFVAARLSRRSMGQMLQSAVVTYLDDHWEELEHRLEIEATSEGKPPEEFFQSIIDSEQP